LIMGSSHRRGLLQRLNESGIFWIMVSIVASSLEPVLAKVGYRGSATPLQFLFIKALVGGVAILPLTGAKYFLGFAAARHFVFITILFTVTTALFLTALKSISAVTVITVLTVTPALVALINQAKGNEILGFKFWSGFLLSLAGIVLTVEIYRADSLALNAAGALCLLAAMIGSATYRTTIDELTQRFSPRTCSLYIFVMNVFLSSLIAVPFMGPIHASVWPLGFVIGIAAAIANVSFLAAIHLLGSTRSSILGLLQRPLVIVAVALILREPLTLVQCLGIILTLAGTQLASVKRKDRKKVDCA
jgi:drug/metabolite transporter (DMT)-like permease